MARQRDYGGEYRARMARGVAAGLSKAQSYGKAARASTSAGPHVPSIRELRASGRLPASKPSRALPMVRDFGIDIGRNVNTLDRRAFFAELRRADALGLRVAVHVKIDHGAGRWRSHEVDGRGTQPELLAGGGAGAKGKASDGRGRRAIGGKPRLVILPPADSAEGEGVDAGELRTFLGAYDDWLDGLYDLALADEGSPS
jgi:hypothetical protein